MDKPISVGDLVQVVKPPLCGCPATVGMTRTVLAIKTVRACCPTCRAISGEARRAVLDGPAPWSKWVIALERLKRIPPLDELEGVKDERDLQVTV